LVLAITSLMEDPARRDRLGKCGRARILEEYDLSRNVEKLASIFAARVKP
jgi:glycosyltransferase involved in cell wall biosynthesis